MVRPGVEQEELGLDLGRGPDEPPLVQNLHGQHVGGPAQIDEIDRTPAEGLNFVQGIQQGQSIQRVAAQQGQVPVAVRHGVAPRPTPEEPYGAEVRQPLPQQRHNPLVHRSIVPFPATC